jgi:hypothetical protein
MVEMISLILGKRRTWMRLEVTLNLSEICRIEDHEEAANYFRDAMTEMFGKGVEFWIPRTSPIHGGVLVDLNEELIRCFIAKQYGDGVANQNLDLIERLIRTHIEDAAKDIAHRYGGGASLHSR